MFENLAFWTGRTAVDLAAQLMFQMDIVKQAPLPAGPKIIAANHPSTSDPALILTLFDEPAHILIEERLFKVPVLGRYLQAAGHICVLPDRGRAAFAQAEAALRRGENVVIFPEGAISPLGGGFHKPRTGVARLALSTGAPVIPVGIHLDCAQIRLITTMVDGKPALGTWYLRGPYALTVGAPLRFTGDVDDRAAVEAAAERVMARIGVLAHQGTMRVLAADAERASRAADAPAWMRRLGLVGAR
jgi:1-acyl-sn-glycerol-3-phosphate acyltransferase